MSSLPRSNILLKELHDKLDALKAKKSTLVNYYGETKGHSYKRGPQLDKIDAMILAVEQEIALMDPSPKRNKRGSAKHMGPGLDDQSRSAFLADPTKEHPDTEAVETTAALLLTWALESMTSGRSVGGGTSGRSLGLSNAATATLLSLASDVATSSQGYRSTSASLLSPDADDSNFFAWLVSSFCDPYITVAAMHLERLPTRWISNIIRLAPADTPEVLSTHDRRELVHKAVRIGDRTLLLHVLTTLSPQQSQVVAAVGLTFEQLRVLTPEEKDVANRLASSVGQIVTSGWADAFRAMYCGAEFKDMERCILQSNPETDHAVPNRFSSSTNPPPTPAPPTQPLSRSQHPSSAAARRRPATAAERWGASVPTMPVSPPSPKSLPQLQIPDAPMPLFPLIDSEDVRSDERRRFALSSVASHLSQGQARFQTFLRLPQKVVHGLLASLHICHPHSSSTLAVDPHAVLEDDNAIFDLTTSVLAATGTSSADLASLAQDQHSCDLLRDPLWVRHHLRRAAMQRRRHCSLELDRGNEEKFWAYFLDELDRAWTEGVDEHVLAAFVMGRTFRDMFVTTPSKATTTSFSRNSSAKSSVSIHNSASTKPLKSKSGSVEPPAPGASGIYLGLASIDDLSGTPASASPAVSRSGNAPITMNPEVCCEAFHVLDNVVHQLSPKESLVFATDDANGPRRFTNDKLNLRADAPVSFEGAYCYHVDVPIATSVAGTYRVGWATREGLPVGLVDQSAAKSSLGDTSESLGAYFAFEQLRENTSSTEASRPLSGDRIAGSSAAPLLASTPQRYRVVLSYWHRGALSEGVSSVIVDFNQKDTDDDASQTRRDSNGMWISAKVTCMLDAVTGDVTFSVEDELLDCTVQLPVSILGSPRSGSAAASKTTFWFPAATLGIRQPPTKQLAPVELASPRRRRSSYATGGEDQASPKWKTKQNRARSPSFSSTPAATGPADTAAATQPQQTPKRIAPPVVWKFYFDKAHYEYQPIPPSNRLLDTLHTILHYGSVVEQFRRAVDSLTDDLAITAPCPPRPTSTGRHNRQQHSAHSRSRRLSLSPPLYDDGATSSRWEGAAASTPTDSALRGREDHQYTAHVESARLRSFLSDFVHSELKVQLNVLEELPAILMPKVLDVDDVLELVVGGDQYARALTHLRISDRTLMRPPQRPDRDRDDRWFPHLARPVVKTKSKFGSMAAMRRSANTEHWNLLVDAVDGLCCPPLHAALLLGHKDAVSLLIRSPLVDVNAMDSVGNTPLILAVQFGLTSIVDYLVVVRGADVSLQNYAGLNALHIAMVNHQQHCLDILLGHPNAVNDSVLNVLTRGKSNAVGIATKIQRPDLVAAFIARGAHPCTPDHFNVTPLCFALRHRDIVAATNILDAARIGRTRKGASDAAIVTKDQINTRERRNPRGTALLYAANIGDANIVQQLLDLGADPTVYFNEPNCNVLHLAVASGSVECLQTLLSVPAILESPTLLNGNSFGRATTPMHLAAEMGSCAMLTALSRCAAVDVNAPDLDGKTPLMILLSSASYDEEDESTAVTVTHIIKRRLRADQTDKAGRTTLSYAAARGAVGVIRILVEACKASVNEVDIHGFTPLTLALSRNQDAAAECILHIAGPKLNFLIARPNVPPAIELAYARGSIVVCLFILELGERCSSELRNKIHAESAVVAAGKVATWGERRVPPTASISYRPYINVYGEGIFPKASMPLGAHGSCASALLSWHANHSGDPQHRRVSASCFGVAATVRPTAAERAAHRVLDFTACGDDAIAVLQRLEQGELAVYRRGENYRASHTASTAVSAGFDSTYVDSGPLFTAATILEAASVSASADQRYNASYAATAISENNSEVQTDSESHDVIADLHRVFSSEKLHVANVPMLTSCSTSPQTRSPATTFLVPVSNDGTMQRFDASPTRRGRQLLHPTMPLEQLVAQLLDAFGEFMPDVKSERALRLASTQVLLLLIEARTNCARHAHLPICHGGYEMSVSRLEALAFQALQLNRESTVVSELQALVRISESATNALTFNVNVSTQSKWSGRNVTMLHLAVLGRNPSAVRYLLSIGADPLIDIAAHEPPNAVADFEALAADSVTSRDFSSSLNTTNDKRPLFVRITCPLLCALRLGDEQITVAMLRHVVDHSIISDDGGAGLQFRLFIPRRNPLGGDSGAMVFEPESVQLLHCIAMLCPQHSWQSSKSLASFWKLCDEFGSQLNTRDSVSGLTAFQMAIACGRSDFVEWATQGKRRHGLSKDDNASVTLDVERVVQLFDALGIRCVALTALEWLRQQHDKATLPQSQDIGASHPLDAGGVAVGHGVVPINLIDFAFVCCPSVVRTLYDCGFVASSPARSPQVAATNVMSTTGNATDRPTPPSSAGSLPRLQSRRSVASTSTQRSPSASPKRSPTRNSIAAAPQSARKRTVAPADEFAVPLSTAATVQWKGTSSLHMALRTLLRAPTDRPLIDAAGGGRPLAHGTTSPLLLGSPSRTFHGSCMHFVPSANVTRQDFGRHITNGIFTFLRAFASQARDISNALVAAAAAAAQELDGESIAPATATAVNVSLSSPPGASASIAPPGLVQLLECDIGLFAVDPHDGSTPFHTAAASGYHTVITELLTAGEVWVAALSKQVVRHSSRAPNASLIAQNSKVMEIKTAVISARNKQNQTVLDVMLTRDMTAPWFQCLCAALEWLPHGSAARIGYAEKLASLVHPLEYPAVAISSGLLHTLAAQQQQHHHTTEVSSANAMDVTATLSKKGHAAQERVVIGGESASRIVTLVFVGMLFSSLSGKQRVTWEALRKVISIPNVTRTLMEHINPCLAAIVLAASSSATSIHKAVQYAKQYPISIREASLERNSAGTSAAAKPALPTSASRGGSPRLSISQAASTGPPVPQVGTLDKVTALASCRPNYDVVEIAPANILVTLTSAERAAVSGFVPPCQFDPCFDALFASETRPICSADRSQLLTDDAGSWHSPPTLTTLADSVDEIAAMLWAFAATGGAEKRVSGSSGGAGASGKRQPQASETHTGREGGGASTLMTAHEQEERVRERLSLWFVAAAHCGMQSVLASMWYRAHVANFSAAETDRTAVVESLLLDKRMFSAACRAKRPRVILYLIHCCGARNFEIGNSNAKLSDGVIPANEVFRRLRFHEESVELHDAQKSHHDSSLPEPPAPRPAERIRRAARLCLKMLFHGRTTISELTIQHIVTHPDLYHINEVSVVHHDSLLHLAVMNRALEAIVALAHTKKFTIGAFRNSFGLQAWEYAADVATLGHALNKRNASMSVSNLAVNYFAAVAIIPDGSQNTNGASSRLELSITSTSDLSLRRRSTFQQPMIPSVSIPPAMVQALQDLMFVVEEDETVELANKPTPVLKVTLPAAVVALRAHAVMHPSAPQLSSAPGVQAAKQRASVALPGSTEAGEIVAPSRGAPFQLRDCDRSEVQESTLREKIVLQALTEVMASYSQRSVSEIVLTDVSTRLAPVDDRKRIHSGRSGDTDRLGVSRRQGSAIKVPQWFGDDESLQVCILPMYW